MNKQTRKQLKIWLIMKAWLNSVDSDKVKKAKRYFKKLKQ